MAREMKDSGIEWIGKVPVEWNLFRLKDYYSFEKGKNAALYTQEYIGQHNGSYPVYSGQTENNGIMGLINTFDYDIDECLFTTTVGAKVMTPMVLSGRFSLSQNCLIMKKRKECNNRFVYYALFPLFDYAKSLIPVYMQPSLRVSDLNKYVIFSPAEKEQRRIADFLDTECGRIDALIEQTLASIEEYKALKQSIITEAVTKGVRGPRPMKDSGVAWIGEIPEEWECKPIKYISTYNDDVLNESTDPNYEFDYIEIGSVEYGRGIIGTEHMKFSESPSRARRIVKEGDIIVSTVRTYLKAVAPIPFSENPLIASTGFVVIRPRIVDPAFLRYAILSNAIISTIEANSVGISYPAINASQVVQFKVPLPATEEQREISEYLEDKCNDIDKLIAYKQQFITELESYKESVIYEYVTGKKLVLSLLSQ